MSDLYRFLIRYGEACHDLRVARHPSESPEWLMTRVLIRVLHHEEGLVFSKGLCHGDWPALYTPKPESPMPPPGNPPSRLRTWIDIGVPSLKKLNRGLRCAERLILYTYGQPSLLAKVLPQDSAGTIQAWHLGRDFLLRVAGTITGHAATWEVETDDNDLTVNRLSGARTRLSPS